MVLGLLCFSFLFAFVALSFCFRDAWSVLGLCFCCVCFRLLSFAFVCFRLLSFRSLSAFISISFCFLLAYVSLPFRFGFASV
jgi:hypothetical protein